MQKTNQSAQRNNTDTCSKPLIWKSKSENNF